jgi:hypothetical protein
MKKVLSLLAIALITALGVSAKTNIIQPTNVANGDLKNAVITALQKKNPALANNAVLVETLTNEVSKNINLDKPASGKYKINNISKKNSPMNCWGYIEIGVSITSIYDENGTLLAVFAEFSVEIYIECVF